MFVKEKSRSIRSGSDSRRHTLSPVGAWKGVAAALLMIGLLAPMSMAVPDEVTLTVDAQAVTRRGADRFVGINVNYMRDADANRIAGARPLNEALKEMGVRWLRYPGGEKSDFYLWSEPPYDAPRPRSLGWYASVPGERMDFDRFIATARAVGAEPYVVVGYDSEQRTGRTRDQWRENAVSWVRYANVVKKYGVRYWEIGNENWHNQTAQPGQMAEIAAEFSQAMKAVDPTIQVGASGNNAAWWAAFLPKAAPHLDFLSMSLYNTWEWKGYDRFVRRPLPNLTEAARQTLHAIDRYAPTDADRKRLKLIVCETNSKDYAPNGWSDANSVGHALVTFDTLGKLLQEERIRSAMVWNTRWVKDEEARDSLFYALGPQNELLPTGWAVALWGRFAQENLAAVSGGTDAVSAYAACSEGRERMTVWIINRSPDSAAGAAVRIALRSPVSYRRAIVRRFSGTRADDTAPSWKVLETRPVADNRIEGLVCPGLSVTVLTLESGEAGATPAAVSSGSGEEGTVSAAEVQR